MSLNNAAFACHVSSAGGIRISNFTLIVFQRIELAETTPLLSRIGESATLGCFVKNVPLGFPNINFTWLVDGTILQDVLDEQKYTFDYDNHGCNLTIDNLQLTDEGRYKCEVRYSLTTVWKSTTLTVAVPPQSVYIIDETTGIVRGNHSHIPQTSSQMFTCLATDTKPAAEITWTINGKTAGMESNEEVVGSRLFNTSSTITVPPVQSGQRENLTCTATGSGRRVAVTLRLIGQQSDGSALQSTLIVIAVTVALLVVFIVTIIVWKHRKRNSSSHANRVTVQFNQIDANGPAAAANPPVTTAIESSANIYEENGSFLRLNSHPALPTSPSNGDGHPVTRSVQRYRPAEPSVSRGSGRQSDVPSTSRQRPTNQREGVVTYIDVHHSRTHPPDAPPIRTEPPTQYADINHYLHPCPVEDPPLDPSPWVGEEGQGTIGLREGGRDEYAPPRPRRGHPISPSVRDWLS
ncbi:T-cell surface protein tactile-like isoform X2 [Acanthaster planci]|uniref:T-cell surface protein tactile-like isoform X2 n=1 Tax=Acanthaster planci TaxID=133434 RepID=A0A8B7Z3D8_ACAPL|nr:T-cell surface protein tactile-like isoform X2 [Acanthaster planci]